MKVLNLALKREYFEAIKAGEKTEEYRLYTDYWRKRLEGKDYDAIRLTLGYPKKDDTARILFKKWLGYTIKTITHKHFGDKPVKVFAITLKR